MQDFFLNLNKSINIWVKASKLEVNWNECPEGFPYPGSQVIYTASSKRKGRPWLYTNFAKLHKWTETVIFTKKVKLYVIGKQIKNTIAK